MEENIVCTGCGCHSDEDVFRHLDFLEESLGEARLEGNREVVMLRQAEINNLHGEIIRRKLTGAYSDRKLEERQKKKGEKVSINGNRKHKPAKYSKNE